MPVPSTLPSPLIASSPSSHDAYWNDLTADTTFPIDDGDDEQLLVSKTTSPQPPTTTPVQPSTLGELVHAAVTSSSDNRASIKEIRRWILANEPEFKYQPTEIGQILSSSAFRPVVCSEYFLKQGGCVYEVVPGKASPKVSQLIKQVAEIYKAQAIDDDRLREKFEMKLAANDEVALMIKSIYDHLQGNPLEFGACTNQLATKLKLVDALTLLDGEWLDASVIYGFMGEFVGELASYIHSATTNAWLDPKCDFTVYSLSVPPHVRHLFLPICVNGHWKLAVAFKHTNVAGSIYLYDSSMAQDDENMRCGTKIAASFAKLSTQTDWLRDVTWSVDVRPSLKQADSSSCGLFVIFNVYCMRSLTHDEMMQIQFTPASRRLWLIKILASLAGASQTVATASHDQALVVPSSPKCAAANEPIDLTFASDKEIQAGYHRSRVLYRWNDGYSYDLNDYLLNEDVASEWDAAWGTDGSAIVGSGVLVIQRTMDQDFQKHAVTWQEHYRSYIPIQDKINIREAYSDTKESGGHCLPFCRAISLSNKAWVQRHADNFATLAWVILGEVELVKSLFTDPSLMSDELFNRMQIYDKTPSDECKNMLSKPWLTALSQAIKIGSLNFCSKGTSNNLGPCFFGENHRFPLNALAFPMITTGRVTESQWVMYCLTGKNEFSHLNGHGTDWNPLHGTIEKSITNISRIRCHMRPAIADCRHNPQCDLEGAELDADRFTMNFWAACQDELSARADFIFQRRESKSRSKVGRKGKGRKKAAKSKSK